MYKKVEDKKKLNEKSKQNSPKSLSTGHTKRENLCQEIQKECLTKFTNEDNEQAN